MASYKWGFWTKIPKISNLKSIFKPIRKFSRLTPNIKKITLGALKVCQVSRNLRNIFCSSSSSFIIHSSSSLPPLRGGCQERGVVVRCERLRCTRLQHRTCKTRRGHFASHGLSAHGLSTERARLAGGTSLRSWFFTRLKCTRLKHRTCKTSRGGTHGLGAHGFSTERARLAGGTSLRSWFQKKYLLPGGIFARGFKKSACYLVGFWFFFPKIPRFWKLKLDFFPLKKVFEIFWRNMANSRYLN